MCINFWTATDCPDRLSCQNHKVVCIDMQSKEEEQQAASADAVFPVILQIMENCIFNAKDPIVLGCTIEEGIAKVNDSRSNSAVLLYE